MKRCVIFREDGTVLAHTKYVSIWWCRCKTEDYQETTEENEVNEHHTVNEHR